MTRLRIVTILLATLLLWPALVAADPGELALLEIEPGPSCGQVDERLIGQVPVEIVIDPKSLERHQQDEYVVLRNDGFTYKEPSVVDPADLEPTPPFR